MTYLFEEVIRGMPALPQPMASLRVSYSDGDLNIGALSGRMSDISDFKAKLSKAQAVLEEMAQIEREIATAAAA